MDTVRPAAASNFYGAQKQPRQRLDARQQTPRSCGRSPLKASTRSPLSSGNNSHFLKRHHSPVRSYGMTNALKDVNGKHSGGGGDIRAGTPPPQSSNRTWAEARRNNLSVEKKFKSISIESEMRDRSPTGGLFGDNSRFRKTYSRRSSNGQQSVQLAPRELFTSNIENQDPDQRAGCDSAAGRKLVTLEENSHMSIDEKNGSCGAQDCDKAVKSPIPLMNLKNSCYINSVVQSLSAFPDFIVSLQKFLNAESKPEMEADVPTEERKSQSTIGVRFPIVRALVMLFLDYAKKQMRPDCEEKTEDIKYRLEKLKQKVGDQSKQFLSDNQQDAGEFFSFLMDAASDEIKKAKTANLIEDWMAVATETRMTCCTCHHVSDPITTHSTSTYIAVPEPNAVTDNTDGAKLTLQKLLTASFQEVEKREFPCPREGCDGRAMDAHRVMTKLPKILVVQLSRISLAGEKITTPVEVDDKVCMPVTGMDSLEDELSAVVDRSFCYELKSVICHIGPSTTKGHYYSLTRNHADGKWYDCDDHEIKRCNLDQVRDEGRNYGYCFFYEKME